MIMKLNGRRITAQLDTIQQIQDFTIVVLTLSSSKFARIQVVLGLNIDQ
jgi:hypothetical protein